jgi:hypothetical protein
MTSISNNMLSPDNSIVHGLWIGNNISQLEILTIKSFINNGHCFYLWLYKPVNNQLPEGVICKDANTIILENQIFRYKYKNQFGHGKGSLGGFSDIFRYKLLYEHGGWWTDMDVTCLKPLNFDQPYIFRTHNKLKLVGNIMKCPKHSLLMKNCYEKAIYEINDENKDWHKPIQILVDEVKNQKLEKFIHDLSNPDSWRLIRNLLIRKVNIPMEWYAIHWVNEEWKRNQINKNIFRENSTLGQIMLTHKLKSEPTSFITSILYWFKLTYIVAGCRQLPWFIKRLIRNQ